VRPEGLGKLIKISSIVAEYNNIPLLPVFINVCKSYIEAILNAVASG
jgi:hypothetical protein